MPTAGGTQTPTPSLPDSGGEGYPMPTLDSGGFVGGVIWEQSPFQNPDGMVGQPLGVGTPDEVTPLWLLEAAGYEKRCDGSICRGDHLSKI
jgi:hypothetical protein